MKFTFVVLVALGLTMAWQASVVADNNEQPISSQTVAHSLTAKVSTLRNTRG